MFQVRSSLPGPGSEIALRSDWVNSFGLGAELINFGGGSYCLSLQCPCHCASEIRGQAGTYDGAGSSEGAGVAPLHLEGVHYIWSEVYKLD